MFKGYLLRVVVPEESRVTFTSGPLVPGYRVISVTVVHLSPLQTGLTGQGYGGVATVV